MKDSVVLCFANIEIYIMDGGNRDDSKVRRQNNWWETIVFRAYYIAGKCRYNHFVDLVELPSNSKSETLTSTQQAAMKFLAKIEEINMV